MVEILKLGNKTVVVDGKIISLFKKSVLLRQLYYGGYEDFDNANGGVWKKYIHIPITTVPHEDAVYKLVIDSTNVSLYSAEDTLKTSSSIASEFWNLVRSDGYDIRVFDHLFRQLYFWTEIFDYNNQYAEIWIKLPANSEALNIAFGNRLASKSSYENPNQVFEFFDDFSTDPSTRYTETADTGSGYFSWDSINQRLKGDAKDAYPQAHYTNNDFILTDGIVELKIVSGTDGGFVFRFQDQNNLYLVAVHDSSNTYSPEAIVVWKRVAGSWTRISDIYQITNPAESEHTLKFKVSGTLLTIWWDGNLVVQDLNLGTDFTSGKIGARIYDGIGYWDDIKVYKFVDPANFETPQILSF